MARALSPVFAEGRARLGFMQGLPPGWYKGRTASGAFA